jgi:hypothetical protein
MGIFHIFRGIRGDSGKIILINGDVPRIVVRATRQKKQSPGLKSQRLPGFNYMHFPRFFRGDTRPWEDIRFFFG